MSDEHKAALAKGRAEGTAVREYLEGLRTMKPRRGRKRTPEAVRRRLAVVAQELDGASPLEELLLVQEARDLRAELERLETRVDLSALEERFVEVAASFSEAKGISYPTWREFGVDAAVLKRAGVKRTHAS